MNEDRYTAGSFNITGEAQHQRRLELRRWHGGDRSVPPPANWINPPAPSAPVPVISAPALRTMAEAPRDGTRIRLHRKPHPNLRHPVVEGWWRQWSERHGFWHSPALGALGSDEYLIGWEPL